MKGFASREEFQKAVAAEHEREFRLHDLVAKALQPAILKRRDVDTPLQIALDFLMVQAYKAHDAVGVLAVNGLAEDAATVTRRLLELGIQAVYIGADSEPDVCEARAGRFLAFLWREANDAAKNLLPRDARTKWGGIADKYGRDIPAKASRWGPSFKAMFVYAELEETYSEDYSLLSRIAHGGPEEFLLHHSSDRFRLRSLLHVPATLLFSSKYYLGVADVWNRQFKLLTDDEIRDLSKRLGEPGEGDAQAI